ncbi:MAG: hypothetical protein F6K31_02475 [Symploca sp. SIO2G7]|nr:hypothetical protein [Symploca sp. SIO2G7]
MTEKKGGSKPKQSEVWTKVIGDSILKVTSYEDKFIPSLWDSQGIVWCGGYVSNSKKARNMAVMSYNRNFRLFFEEGLADVDPELLIRLPFNELIYINNSGNVERLIKDLDVENPEIVPLLVDQWGIIIDGNSRHAAVETLNAGSDGNKFPRVPVEIRTFSDNLERLRQLKLRNSYRVKTKMQQYIEAQLMLQIEKQEVERKKRRGEDTAIARHGRSIDRVAATVGTGRTTLQIGFNVVEAIQKEENADLAKKWSKLLEEGTNKMAYDILSVPTEDREAVIDQLYNPEGKLRKKVSVERAYNEVKAERLIDAERESSGNSNDASGEAVDGETKDSDNLRVQHLKIQRELGDKPSDNWYTPQEILDLVLEVLGEIDVDPFSDLSKRIPAHKHYTIADSAFEPHNHWEGRVFANILYSDLAKCMQRASKEIVEGYTKKSIYLCDSGVLFNKKTQNIIDQHEMSICAWNGRIEFVPGDLLITDNPNAGSNASRINSLFLFYSEDPALHRRFSDIFSPYGKVYHDVSYYLFNQNPLDLVWEDNKTRLLDCDLSIEQAEDGLWIARAGGDVMDSLVDANEAQTFAIALAVKSLSTQNPFQ